MLTVRLAPMRLIHCPPACPTCRGWDRKYQACVVPPLAAQIGHEWSGSQCGHRLALTLCSCYPLMHGWEHPCLGVMQLAPQPWCAPLLVQACLLFLRELAKRYVQVHAQVSAASTSGGYWELQLGVRAALLDIRMHDSGFGPNELPRLPPSVLSVGLLGAWLGMPWRMSSLRGAATALCFVVCRATSSGGRGHVGLCCSSTSGSFNLAPPWVGAGL
jgi:hypothetical protein